MIHPLIKVLLGRETWSLSHCWLWGKVLAVLLQNAVDLGWSLVLWHVLLDSNTSKNSFTKSNQASCRLSCLRYETPCCVLRPQVLASPPPSLLTGTLMPSRSAEACPWQFVFCLQSPVSWFLTIWPSYPLVLMFFSPLIPSCFILS